MPNTTWFLDNYTPLARTLLRIVSGFLLSLHGLTLLFGFFSAPDHPAKPVVAFSLLWFAGVLQFVGGPLLILGLFTRPAAFILSGHLAFAYFLAHAPRGFWPNLNGGELSALYSFVFLYLAVAGPGDYSLDGLLNKVKNKNQHTQLATAVSGAISGQ